jgi:hypothetical protein
MAMHGQIPVQFGAVFPDGAYAAGGFEMVRDFVPIPMIPIARSGVFDRGGSEAA